MTRAKMGQFVDQFVAQEEQITELLKADPDYPLRERERDRREAVGQIQELRKLLDVCTRYVTKLKSLISKITDHTVQAACYLLFCQALQNFEALLSLAADGFHYQVSVLLRTIREALDLVVLFLCEGQESPNLKKWFDGEIIPNKIARKAVHEFINEGRNEILEVEGTKTTIYGIFSNFNHMSYVALLQSIDVFARDFDFRRCAGFYNTRAETLPQAKVELQGMVVMLRHFYRSLGDSDTCRELNEILNASRAI